MSEISEIKSSYKNSLNYKDIFKTICFMHQNCKKIVEIGILDGYSLKTIADSVSNICQIDAYDIFDDFNGNRANKEKLNNIFTPYTNVNILYGDFYNLVNTFDNNSIDILHIDIANNGNIYEYVFNNYINKIKNNGIIVLEGGSNERDNIEWMNKYNYPKMKPILEQFSSTYNILTIGNIPSITIITKK